MGFACNLPDCPECGERRALTAQEDALAKFAEFPDCLSLRLSVDMHRDLDTAWRDLGRARATFMKNARLSRTTLGYLRSTEVTRPDARWNVHDHWVVIPRGNAADEQRRLLAAWEDACRATGLEPSSHPQFSDTPSALEYILKPRLGTGEGSLRHLLIDAARGDADAHDDWQEWDAWRRAHPRARFRSSWLAPVITTPEEKIPTPPRDQSATTVPDRDLALMALLDALGATTNAQHELMLGMSRRSIQRRRTSIPDARPGLIPYRITHT
ncbi:hypothetical protein [Microbacterium sp. 16-032]|uniref:hypothetical protein n=1 Tax=Microbacterium sp. 16-032 TaxID=3239808 RepID=UPI0034E2D351